ncbi:MAG: GNAT family N-acetyltransferase [Flavobacteriaceae bacterium]|nr:GNAT family N-acetyltransferase [Flavobacteriaceae bacterium]MBL6678695.1 GNAT family N-acetyltransferase [Flavobacteriaceae bacterium]|tara:strand:+ start:12814 stop:13215 length:402 start_codon:yes stop_codon:yes gene_type:complete
MIKICDFKEKDFNNIKNLLLEGFSKNFDKNLNLDFIKNQNSFGFLAKNNTNTIGYASVHIIDKINRRSCLIEDVVVEKNQRGKGVGKKLIMHIINFSKSKSCDKIILNSSESNILFYEKLGFVQNEIQLVMRI